MVTDLWRVLAKINTADDPSASDNNFVNFDPVT